MRVQFAISFSRLMFMPSNNICPPLMGFGNVRYKTGEKNLFISSGCQENIKNVNVGKTNHLFYLSMFPQSLHVQCVLKSVENITDIIYTSLTGTQILPVFTLFYLFSTIWYLCKLIYKMSYIKSMVFSSFNISCKYKCF